MELLHVLGNTYAAAAATAASDGTSASSGSVQITIDEKSLTARAGDMVIMPANRPHALNAVEPFKMALVMIKEK